MDSLFVRETLTWLNFFMPSTAVKPEVLRVQFPNFPPCRILANVRNPAGFRLVSCSLHLEIAPVSAGRIASLSRQLSPFFLIMLRRCPLRLLISQLRSVAILGALARASFALQSEYT